MLKRVLFICIFMLSMLHSIECSKKVNISSREDIPLFEVLQQVSNLCKVSMFIQDDLTLEHLRTPYKTLYVTNAKYQDIIKHLLEKNFFYHLADNVLSVSYLGTKVFKLNYLSLDRTSQSSTTLAIQTIASSGENDSSSSSSNGGITVNVNNKFNFWEEVKENLQTILSKQDNEDNNNHTLVINEKTGSIYIRASKRKLQEAKKYIIAIKENINKQVLVDVNIYQVQLNESRKTGIDWSQISSLQNIKAGININSSLGSLVSTAEAPANANSFTLTKDISIDSILSFIKRYGKTNSLSNPRILAINNQPAVISIGRQIYYKIVKSTTSSTAEGSTKSQGEQVESVFSGLVVDIMPSISKDNKIILKINNSITSIVNSNKSQGSSITASIRNIPPDLDKKEISTVISAKDGQKIILGGLISTNKLDGQDGIRWLGNIPFLGFFFGADTVNKSKSELVIIITPKIIN